MGARSGKQVAIGFDEIVGGPAAASGLLDVQTEAPGRRAACR